MKTKMFTLLAVLCCASSFSFGAIYECNFDSGFTAQVFTTTSGDTTGQVNGQQNWAASTGQIKHPSLDRWYHYCAVDPSPWDYKSGDNFLSIGGHAGAVAISPTFDASGSPEISVDLDLKTGQSAANYDALFKLMDGSAEKLAVEFAADSDTSGKIIVSGTDTGIAWTGDTSYHVQVNFNQSTGAWNVEVTDLATSSILSGTTLSGSVAASPISRVYFYGGSVYGYYTRRRTNYDNIVVSAVPEPATIGLMAFGTVGWLSRKGRQ